MFFFSKIELCLQNEKKSLIFNLDLHYLHLFLCKDRNQWVECPYCAQKQNIIILTVTNFKCAVLPGYIFVHCVTPRSSRQRHLPAVIARFCHRAINWKITVHMIEVPVRCLRGPGLTCSSVVCHRYCSIVSIQYFQTVPL